MKSNGHPAGITRRSFLQTTTVGTAAAITGRCLLAGEAKQGRSSPYKRANTDWLGKCRFGVGVHWTAQTVPRSGPRKPFQKAVDDFDLDGFVKTVAALAEAGGGRKIEVDRYLVGGCTLEKHVRDQKTLDKSERRIGMWSCCRSRACGPSSSGK